MLFFSRKRRDRRLEPRTKKDRQAKPLLDELENRYTISESLFTGMQVQALLAPALLEAIARDRFQTERDHRIVPTGGSGRHAQGAAEQDARLRRELADLSRQRGGGAGDDHALTARVLRRAERQLAHQGELSPDLVNAASGDVFTALRPRAHGQIRKLTLAPPASTAAGRASSVAVAHPAGVVSEVSTSAARSSDFGTVRAAAPGVSSSMLAAASSDILPLPIPGSGSGGSPSGGGSLSLDSLSDSAVLYVLNWNDGLVMAQGVKEFDKPGDFVDLRAQVYGATVQSYSWDLSQAANAGCISATNTYKLTFAWNSNSSPSDATNTITLTVTMTDSSTQTKTLTFSVAHGSNSCTGGGGTSATWPAVLPPDKPNLAQEEISSDSMTRPYAVSLGSGTLSVAHQSPAYNPGVPALDLTYSSQAAERKPIFIDRYEINPSNGIPNTVSARVQFDGTWGSSFYYDTSTYIPGDVLQIALQADGGSKAAGRYSYSVETTAHYTGSDSTSTSSGSINLINEEASPFGEGWTLDLVDQLHVVTGGVILNQGAGNSLWFASGGSGGYTTPAGDFSTLTLASGTYTRTLKDGTKQNFNSSGMETSLVDRNSNRFTFTYTDADSDGLTDELQSIKDPNGLLTTFTYSGDCGAGSSPARACKVTDPAGRVTTFSYNSSGQLTSLKDPDGAVTSFGYDTSSGRMTTFTDPRGNVTSFAYDFSNRITTITRADSTTEVYSGLQHKGLLDSGQGTSGSPATALLAAEAVSGNRSRIPEA